MKGGRRILKDNEKKRSDIPKEEYTEKIDFKNFAPEKEKSKKTNVFKLLFKKNKAFELSSDSDERPTVDIEAKKISERFGLAYSILWIVLIVFVVMYFAFFSDSITTGSMKSVFRDMLGHGKTEGTVPNYGYSVNDNAIFTELAGVPAVVGSDRVVIFAPDGSHQFSDESPYEMPDVRTSEKYMLVYDTLGSAFGIYDAFGPRYTETTGGRIVSGAIADNGASVIARKGSEYSSEISVYTPNFELLNLIKKNNRVASIDIKPDGSEIMVLSYRVYPDGNVESELLLLEVRSDSPRKLLTLNEGMPLECKYLDSGQMILLFDDMICLFDNDGNEMTSTAIDTTSMFSYTLSENGELLYLTQSYSDSADFTVNLLKPTESGVKKYQCKISGKPSALSIYNDKAYVVSGSKVTRLDIDGLLNSATVSGDKTVYGVLIIDSKEYVAYADSLIFKEFTLN